MSIERLLVSARKTMICPDIFRLTVRASDAGSVEILRLYNFEAVDTHAVRVYHTRYGTITSRCEDGADVRRGQFQAEASAACSLSHWSSVPTLPS